MLVENLDSGAREIWVQIPVPLLRAVWSLTSCFTSPVHPLVPSQVELVTEPEVRG